MIEIAEVGMVTSVGRDARTTLASVLCGMTRPKEIPYFSTTDPEFQELEGVIGHPIEALTEGFHLFGLWIRAGLSCLQDLMSRASLPLHRGADAWQRTALIAVVPNIRSGRFMSNGDESVDDLREPYLNRIAGWLGIPQTHQHVHVVSVGRTGIFGALRAAEEILANHTVDRVLILAVDSLLDTLTLEWLAASHRLKSASTPMGLMPGEAAAALIVERPGSATRAGALNVAVRVAAEHAPPAEREITNAFRGERLAAVLEQCFAGLRDTAGENCMLVSDQNGEQWRAEEFAYCNLRLADAWPVRTSVLLPAASLGDTGAASGAVSCCLGALALRSGMLRVRESVVVGSSSEGRAGAALMSVL